MKEYSFLLGDDTEANYTAMESELRREFIEKFDEIMKISSMETASQPYQVARHQGGQVFLQKRHHSRVSCSGEEQDTRVAALFKAFPSDCPSAHALHLSLLADHRHSHEHPRSACAAVV